MRTLLLVTTFFLLSIGVPLQAQQLQDENSCKFKVNESAQKATVAGPDEFVRLAYVVDQPDSPVEILAIDFQDSSSPRNGNNLRGRMRFKVKVHNRSDRAILGLSVVAWLLPGSGGAGIGTHGLPQNKPRLQPGEEIELQTPAGNASRGEAKGDSHYVVEVQWVGFEGCQYYPSLRLPFNIAENPFYHFRSFPNRRP